MKSEILKMDRRASDNEYLHKDFHLSMNMLLEYINEKYGDEAVIEYLKKFTLSFHAPLISKLKEGTLAILKEYFINILDLEKAKYSISISEDKLEIKINECPGVKHIKDKGFIPTKMYKQTYETVYKTMCEGTDFEYKLASYDNATGKSINAFTRKEVK